jgi:hypothetical protein
VRIAPAALFVPRWSCLWATAYQFEPPLFEEFLLRRLGEPPLNVTLLLDGPRLAETWERLGDAERRRLRRVGRDYLARGVRLGGSFHAKTSLFANERDGILLVGSGNLTMRGLEQGHEVFSRFSSSDPGGLAAIQTWRDWMQGIVEEMADDDVHRRWWDVRTRARWLGGPASSAGPFVTNQETSMLDHLRELAPGPVEELHVLAPFMDREAAALRELALALRPSRVHVYVSDTVSVDGGAIRGVLASLPSAVHVWAFLPDEFVHAKLVGVCSGDEGVLLAGSANLSRAAFIAARSSERWANVEAGVVCRLPAETVRGYFRPPGLAVQEVGLARLASLSYRESQEASGRPYVLRSAQRRSDGRIEVRAEPMPPSDGTVHVATPDSIWPLRGQETVQVVPVEAGGVIVILADAEARALSNPVPLDDLEALAAALREPRPRSDRPAELDLGDVETPIGAMLQRLHRACIFDVEETAAVASAERAASDPEAIEADPAFWDRLLQEELALDRRTAAYHRFGSPALPIDDDEVLFLLRQMLDRTPAPRGPGAGGGEAPIEPEEASEHGTRWTPTQHLQVRLVHVLQRWSRATNDPRLRWVNPLAPVRNFAALVTAIAECWEEDYLPRPKLLAITRLLFESFITSEEVPGYLLSLSPEHQVATLERLPEAARSVASALLYAALRPDSDWQAHVFEWQAFLVPGIELGVFQARAGTDALVRRLTGAQVTLGAVDDRLMALADYVDDPQWCARLAKDLDLAEVRFQPAALAPPFKLALSVQGVADPLSDPRIPVIVRRAFAYKRVAGILLVGSGWRLSVLDGQAACLRLPDTEMRESRLAFTDSYLAELERQRLPLRDAFPAAASIAS